MRQKHLFEMLGAPLRNFRWSWGAVRDRDRVVFLRVWKDRIQLHKGCPFAKVASLKPHSQADHGYQERLEHVNLVKDGAPCYLIICEAVDVDESPRRIASFDETSVIAGGKIEEFDGALWIEMCSARRINEVIRG